MSHCDYKDFDPDIDYELHPGATAVFNNKLWYFTTGQHHDKINRATYDMSNLDSLDVAGGWEKHHMPEIRDDHIPRSNARPAAVVINGRLYFFWNESEHNHGIWAATLDTDENWSDKAIKILSPKLSGHFEKGKAINPKEYVYLAAYRYNDDIILSWTSDSKNYLYHMRLKVDDIDTDKHKWQGKKVVAHKFSDVGVDGKSSKISMAWFSQVKNDKPVGWLVYGFYENGSDQFRSFALKLDDDGLPKLDKDKVVFDSHDASRGVSIARDPGGRIMAYYVSSGGHIHFRILNTFQELKPGSWGEETKLNGKDTSTKDIPVPAYVFGASSACTYTGNGTNGKVKVPATCYPVYEFVMYSTSDEQNDAHKIRGQVAQYGTIKVIPNYAGYQLFRADGSDPKNGTNNPTLLVINGIVDGPIPIPQENVGSAILGRPIGTVTYGTTNTGTSGHSVSTQMVSGLRTSGGITQGVGPAWDVEYKQGLGDVIADTTTTIVEVPFVGNTVVNPGTDGTAKVQNTGILFTEAVTLVEDAYFFFDCHGNQVSAQNAPEYGLIKTASNMKPVNYEVFSAVPGDLLSYTAAAVNARMKKRYKTYKKNLKKQEDDVFGSNYKDYVDKVLIPNAMELANGQNYLEFGWSNSGNVEPRFQVINTNMVERSWTLQSSLYIGISGGVKLREPFFGIGKATQFQVLTGIEFKYEAVKSESNSDAWGIAADLNGLPSGDEPGEISGYTWRLYFLPENRLWADEIRYLSTESSVQESVDPNSKPWKIMFLIDETTISYQPATITITKAVFANDKVKVKATTTDQTGTANLIASFKTSQNDKVITVPMTYNGNGEYVTNAKWKQSDPPTHVTISSFKGSSASNKVTAG